MISRYLRPPGRAAVIAIGLLAATRAQAVDFKVHGTLDLVADECSEACDFNLLVRRVRGRTRRRDPLRQDQRLRRQAAQLSAGF